MKKLWGILTGESNSVLAKAVNYSIITLIVLNVIAFVLSTESSINAKLSKFFDIFEIFSIIIFSIEYFLRILTCPSSDKFQGNFKGRIKFIFTPMAIVDLISILPFYLPFIGIDLRVVRVLRIFRIFRIAKIARYYSSLKLIQRVFRSRKEELLLTSFIMIALLLISATLMYYAEQEAQPNKFASIPEAMWWAVITLSTVGYGDVSPITPMGKIIGGIIAVIGVGLFALPVGIIGSGFLEEIQKGKNNKSCPHCGKELT
jgi:voltage-gated potassium channel